MTGIFAFVMANKWAQYALGALLLVGLYVGWTAHERSVGKSVGVEQQKQAEVQHVGDTVVDAANRQNADLVESKKREAVAIDQAVTAQKQAAAALDLAAKMHKQGEDLKAQLARMSDSDLHPYIVGKLGLRAPGDASACYLPKEERALAAAVDQWPVCEQEKQRDVDAIAKKDEQIDKLVVRIDELLDRDKGREAYAGTLESALTQLYNEHPPKVKSWTCVKMWKCGKGQLKIPKLADLQAEAQKQNKGVSHQ